MARESEVLFQCDPATDGFTIRVPRNLFETAMRHGKLTYQLRVLINQNRTQHALAQSSTT